MNKRFHVSLLSYLRFKITYNRQNKHYYDLKTNQSFSVCWNILISQVTALYFNSCKCFIYVNLCSTLRPWGNRKYKMVRWVDRID